MRKIHALINGDGAAKNIIFFSRRSSISFHLLKYKMAFIKCPKCKKKNK